MFKYYTSYFSNYANIPENYLCVAIARYSPDFFTKETLGTNRAYGDLLAPSEDLLHKFKNSEISEDEYKKTYVTELSQALQHKGYNSFKEYFDKVDREYSHGASRYDGIVFFCYERPGEFCHRHILAKIMKLCGYECQEWTNRKEIKNNALF